MKIIKFEDFFHPHAGYNINILAKYLSKNGHELIIITSEIEKSPGYLRSFFDCSNIEEKDRVFEQENNVIIERVKTHLFISGRAIVSLKVFKRMLSYRPDIIFINGNDTFVGVLSTIGHNCFKVPIIYSSSMVEMASTNRLNWLFRFFYRLLVAPIIRRNKIKVIRTQDDDYVARFLGIPLTLAPHISLGVDTDMFFPSNKPIDLLNQLELSINDFVVIYAGKIDVSKGADILFSVLKAKIESYKRIVFVIIGNVNTDVHVSFDETVRHSNNKIIHLPTALYSELNKFYHVSDLAIFPRQISLSFFNVQACGLPVIAESNNINDERLSHGNGYVFEYGNSSDLLDKIISVSMLDQESYNLMSKKSVDYIKNNFDYNKLINDYIELFIAEDTSRKLKFLNKY
jgi:glycosyltransferase involved in cell wall biosynthesis